MTISSMFSIIPWNVFLLFLLINVHVAESPNSFRLFHLNILFYHSIFLHFGKILLVYFLLISQMKLKNIYRFNKHFIILIDYLFSIFKFSNFVTIFKILFYDLFKNKYYQFNTNDLIVK